MHTASVPNHYVGLRYPCPVRYLPWLRVGWLYHWLATHEARHCSLANHMSQYKTDPDTALVRSLADAQLKFGKSILPVGVAALDLLPNGDTTYMLC
jgi:hypothetical protein